MRISRQVVTASRTCAICERTLLVGERAVRYSPDGENFVDVCPLCLETAVDHGWLKEGSPTSPVMAEPRRKRLGGLGAALRVAQAAGRTGGGRADPAPALRARAGDG